MFFYFISFLHTFHNSSTSPAPIFVRPYRFFFSSFKFHVLSWIRTTHYRLHDKHPNRLAINAMSSNTSYQVLYYRTSGTIFFVYMHRSTCMQSNGLKSNRPPSQHHYRQPTRQHVTAHDSNGVYRSSLVST